MSVELEICCYTIADALVAERAGADRIELCAGEPEGGTTPSFGALAAARDHIQIPVFPMVRPRGGNFVYDDFEYAQMASDAAMIAELGFPGLVIGALTMDGELPIAQLEELLAAGRTVNPAISTTFHRAFDEAREPDRAFGQLADLGFDRVLTSGQATTAVQGIDLIADLAAVARPAVMPGGGVRPDNVEKFLSLGVTNVHSSASREPGAGVSGDVVETLAQLVH